MEILGALLRASIDIKKKGIAVEKEKRCEYDGRITRILHYQQSEKEEPCGYSSLV